MERNKIHLEAVKQAERLAAIHDKSGKLFNVGEVVVMEDGQVKNVERLKRQAEVKAWKDAERAAREAHKKAQDAFKTGYDVTGPIIDGVNPARQSFIQNLAKPEVPGRISNKQKKSQELHQPKYVPSKPVIPEGYSVPTGEVDYIALWDITDEDIMKRLNEAKFSKKREAKKLRKMQREQKVFNKAMKALRKLAVNRGEPFDPEKAKREILGEQDEQKVAGNIDDSISDIGSESDSDTSSDSDSDSENEVNVDEPATTLKSNSKKRKQSVSEGGEEEPKSKKAKKAKKAKKSSSDDGNIAEINPVEKVKLKKVKQGIKLLQNLDEIPQSAQSIKTTEVAARGDKAHRSKKRRAEEEEATVVAATPVESVQAVELVPKSTEIVQNVESTEPSKKKSKKIKKTKTDEGVEAPQAMEATVGETSEPQKRTSKKKNSKTIETDEPASGAQTSVVEISKSEKKKKKPKAEDGEVKTAPVVDASELEGKKKKKSRKSEQEVEVPSQEPTSVAMQWNPDALTGNAARQEKFLRLLGAKKSGAMVSRSDKSSKKFEDVAKIETDLERQYEAGIKHKHGGGNRHMGLGA
jgi:hypothetical protein